MWYLSIPITVPYPDENPPATDSAEQRAAPSTDSAAQRAAPSIELLLPGLAATHAVGAALGARAEAGDVYGLDGPLGAGKTSLAQGFARGLGIPPDVPVQSPTFALVYQYDLGRVPLVHADRESLSRFG